MATDSILGATGSVSISTDGRSVVFDTSSRQLISAV